ncbi:hypothetical protein BH24CHL1_BH24CHL1_07010 [soil metagenome]
MQRVTITIPDDLMVEIDAFRRREGTSHPLESVVEDALRRFFAHSDKWGGREYRPPSGPLLIRPGEVGSGKGDISIEHDRHSSEP